MFRKHRTTIAYTALSVAIALAAVAVWMLTTGRRQLPPGAVGVFSIGAALIATGIERTVAALRGRRSRDLSQHWRRPASSPLAERANGLPTELAPTEGEA